MSHHVLLLGGHGKVAQLLTPLLLKRGWTVTSVIRNHDQVADVQALGPKGSQLNVLVDSIEDVKSDADARQLLDRVRPDYVVFSAGAGGKGGASRTFAIDRDAASHFIKAAADTTSSSNPVTRFLLVSYVSSRRAKPAWWDDATWAAAQEVNRTTLANYYEAKIAADEVLYRAGKQNKNFAAIDLRPGWLTDEPAGPVELGRTSDARGSASRATVAAVADLLLAHPETKSAWVDLVDGKEDAAAAVDRVVREGVDAVEGEPVTQE